MLSAWVSSMAEDTTDYDFCEPNANGTMLYYRYVEENYCEVVKGLEHYSGVISIPAYVTERQIPVVGVGYLAFSGCKGLTEVYLPSTMLYLETASFYRCSNLQKIVLNDNLIAIGQNAFEGCSELSSINIPQTLEYLGYEAFCYCTKMRSILYNDKYFFYYPGSYEPENPVFTIPEGIEVIGEGAFIFTLLEEVVIPNTVKIISDYAFDGSTIQRVKIPSSVETIGNHAFSQTLLEEVVVPSSVKNFGEHMFYHTIALKKAVLENPLDSIPYSTFDSSIGLKEVHYPSTVHRLGDFSFCQCLELTQLPDLSNINQIGIYAFYACYGLNSVTIPASITKIPDYAFCMCLGVKEVNLPEGIESIGEYAFWQLPLLNSIVIPKSIKSIGEYAFAACGLKDVYVQWQYPLELQHSIFSTSPETTLHVPAGTAERYANAQYWSKFKNIVEDVTSIENVRFDNKKDSYSRPVKQLIGGKIVIDGGTSGKLLIDGRKYSD